jgi:hypothetical protein
MSDSMLKVIGYWKGGGWDAQWVHPSLLVRPQDADVDRDRILGYLRSGGPVFEYLGFSYCRFSCGEPDESMGHRELTDGEWLWPEGLVHYVQVHNVLLPSEFVETIRRNRFTVPRVSDIESLVDTPKDFGFWKNWSTLACQRAGQK